MKLPHLYKVKFSPEGWDIVQTMFPPSEYYCVTVDFVKRFVELSLLGVMDYFESIERVYIPEEKTWKGSAVPCRVLITSYYAQGDQCFKSAFIRELQKNYPETVIGTLILPNAKDIFKHTSVFEEQIPLPWHIFEGYNYYADLSFAPGTYDQTDTRTQVHRFMDKFGMPYTEDCDKPELCLLPEETDSFFNEFQSRTGKKLESFGYAVVQMHSTNTAKDIPPDLTRRILMSVMRQFPQMPILLCGAEQKGAAFYEQIGFLEPDIFGVYPIIKYSKIKRAGEDGDGVNCDYDNRQILAMIKNAKFVISPDSFFAHAAAAFDVASIAIYGAFSPLVHVANYKYCIPIWHKESCEQSPCRWHFTGLPPNCPSKDEGVCKVVASTTPEEVIAAVRKLMSRNLPFPTVNESIVVEYPVASE